MIKLNILSLFSHAWSKSYVSTLTNTELEYHNRLHYEAWGSARIHPRSVVRLVTTMAVAKGLKSDQHVLVLNF